MKKFNCDSVSINTSYDIKDVFSCQSYESIDKDITVEIEFHSQGVVHKQVISGAQIQYSTHYEDKKIPLNRLEKKILNKIEKLPEKYYYIEDLINCDDRLIVTLNDNIKFSIKYPERATSVNFGKIFRRAKRGNPDKVAILEKGMNAYIQ
jgi:hypothetical protein